MRLEDAEHEIEKALDEFPDSLELVYVWIAITVNDDKERRLVSLKLLR